MRLLGFYDYTVILTYMSLLSAFAGMNFSGRGMDTAAVLCLMFCGICDAFDGTVARTKRNRTEEGIVVHMQDTSDIEWVHSTVERYNASLPPAITASPKFRLFYLRAVIDRELMIHGGYARRSALATEAMREINRIYFADERTNPWVMAPAGL